jgi:3-methyladenine DNA glycosylase AlkD
MVPAQRQIAYSYSSLSLKDIKSLLTSRIHEHRLAALVILVGQYQKSDEHGKKKIADFYIAHAACINNCDLVDLSALHILCDYCYEDPAILYRLTASDNLRERRMSIMATFAFIRKGRFKEPLEIAERLLHDRHDLIHKAVDWMLKEIGKMHILRQKEISSKARARYTPHHAEICDTTVS